MLSDEARKALDLLKNIDKQKCMMLKCPVVKNNIERQLKIIELNRIIRKQSKEIEELKKKNKTLKNLQNDTNRLYIEMIERKNYFERELEKNDKKWENKIKAKIEIRKEEKENCKDSIEEKYLLREIYVLQSLLEKE